MPIAYRDQLVSMFNQYGAEYVLMLRAGEWVVRDGIVEQLIQHYQQATRMQTRAGVFWRAELRLQLAKYLLVEDEKNTPFVGLPVFGLSDAQAALLEHAHVRQVDMQRDKLVFAQLKPDGRTQACEIMQDKTGLFIRSLSLKKSDHRLDWEKCLVYAAELVERNGYVFGCGLKQVDAETWLCAGCHLPLTYLTADRVVQAVAWVTFVADHLEQLFTGQDIL